MTDSPEDILNDRRALNRSRELARTGWYHSFQLPDGRTIEGLAPLEVLHARVAQMPIPKDLTGKRVLDIGAWDGWFSFEMERRGAEVVAVDCVEVDNFLYMHEQLGSKVVYRVMDVYDLTPERVGRFDIVLFLGVLYHLKHPLLALEKVCALTKEVAVIDSFVTDWRRDWSAPADEIPQLEFYETDELGGQLDCWFGPNRTGLLALCRTAGFVRVGLLGRSAEHAVVECWRHWEPAACDPALPAARLTAAVHEVNQGINFHADRGEYVRCGFDFDGRISSPDEIFPEVGGYAIRPVAVRNIEANHWQANFILPPGLEPGWHEVRLRIGRGQWSQPWRIAVDVPQQFDEAGSCFELRIVGAYDSMSWTPGKIEIRANTYVSAWVGGLPENADRTTVRVYLDDVPLKVGYVQPPGEEPRQINARVPRSVGGGSRSLVVCVGESRSVPFPVTLEPPA